MKWFLIIFIVGVIFTASHMIRRDIRKAAESSAASFSKMYARDVLEFYRENNRFPIGDVELSNALIGFAHPASTCCALSNAYTTTYHGLVSEADKHIE